MIITAVCVWKELKPAASVLILLLHLSSHWLQAVELRCQSTVRASRASTCQPRATVCRQPILVAGHYS